MMRFSPNSSKNRIKSLILSATEKGVWSSAYPINYMNKIKTRRSTGTKILGVPGIKEIKMI